VVCVVGGVANAQVSPVLASSELTLRTTSSVDIQVCIDGVLSEERDGVQATVAARLREALQKTTAVYLIRTFTLARSGATCLVYVYQASTPALAAMAEVDIASGEPKVGQMDTLTVTHNGATLVGTLTVAPWRGEDPPLPVWGVSADELVQWTLGASGVLGACLVAACCFVVLSSARDTRRIREVLAEDRQALKRLLEEGSASSTAVVKMTKKSDTKKKAAAAHGDASTTTSSKA
jgi:hypothetical protein